MKPVPGAQKENLAWSGILTPSRGFTLCAVLSGSARTQTISLVSSSYAHSMLLQGCATSIETRLVAAAATKVVDIRLPTVFLVFRPRSS